jgi:hypothetical protein
MWVFTGRNPSWGYVPAPKTLPGFPDAVPAKGKAAGAFLSGTHPDTGERTKDGDPTRRVEK